MSSRTSDLGEVVRFQNGGTPSKAVPAFFEGEIPWITGADIVGPIAAFARAFITEDAVRKSAVNLVPAGTVLLVTRTSVGKVAIAGKRLGFSQDITALTPDRQQLDASYLVHFLRLKQTDLARQARGATIKGITREVVASLEIPLPSLVDQRRIAAILDQADELRAKRRAALAHLDDLTQSIFLDMFGDPVKNLLGWPITTLMQLGQLDRGVSRHRPRNDPSLLGGRHPLIQTGEVANSGGYIRSFTGTYSDAGLAQSMTWPAGTLCITIAANIAKTGILTFDACFPDSVVGFTSDRATTQYVRVWLGFLQGTLERSAPQSAQKNINLAILRNLPVPKPSVESIEQFAKRVELLEEAKCLATTDADGLDGLFASLQSRAFVGKL